jgi:hypothetical protein
MLTSLSIPASLTVVSTDALRNMKNLTSLTFEPGTKLREIARDAFPRCPSLKSIFLPASLSKIDGSAFIDSSIEKIHVDEANPHYFVSGDFLIASQGMTFVRYFGLSTDLVIGSDCRPIGPYCFAHCGHLLTILFDAGWRLPQIMFGTFLACRSLKSICIPASVEVISGHSFNRCSSLSELTFESGSRLIEIGAQAFCDCFSLVSICIPANVERLLKHSFARCSSLTSMSFERGSKLSRIGPFAFFGCSSIRSFCIPAQLEVMEWTVLSSCQSLTELTFEIPSRLKTLALPPSEFGCLCIPDSVEVISGSLRRSGARSCLLQFSDKSQLKIVRLGLFSRELGTVNDTQNGIGIFICLSEGQLRQFRSKCEFS